MPQYTVPKFIEMEPKIVGPFTFKQFTYIAIAAAILFILWFSVPFYLFVIFAIILMGGALTLSFLKIEGRSLPTILKNFLIFSVKPRIYIWKKKLAPPKIIKEKPKIKEEIEPESVLKITKKGHLRKISNHIEIGIK